MNLLYDIHFEESVAEAAGFGARSALLWWAARTGSDGRGRRVHVAVRRGSDLTLVQMMDSTPNRRPVVCFSQDSGSFLLVTHTTILRVPLKPGMPTQAAEFSIDGRGITSIATLDGRSVFLARALEWPPAWQLDLESGQTRKFEPARDDVSKHFPLIALSPDGRHLAFGHVFDAIEVFDVATGEAQAWPDGNGTVREERGARDSDLLARLAFNDGHLLAISHPRDKERPFVLRLGNVSGGPVVEVPLQDRLPIVAIAPGGRIGAAARKEPPGTIDVFDCTTGNTLDTADVGSRPLALSFDAPGTLSVVHRTGVTVFEQ